MFFHVANFYINATTLKGKKIELLFVELYIYCHFFTIRYSKRNIERFKQIPNYTTCP